jgi:anion-transporting  ArsA/GET3 family ATPase
VIETVADRRIVVCCGAGGVGKTTVSAAVGMLMAHEGARVVVVTIDPARRLATALGMADLSDEPRRVPAWFGPAGGELWALHLDAKATFDRLVAREAPTPEARERILANRIYRHLSGAVAGSQDYMAVERLHELADDGSFDAIVLDTPPSQNALDFLDAPARISRFIEGRALRLLLRPPLPGAGFGRRVIAAGSATVFSLLQRLTGTQLLRDVSDFLAAFDGMYDGFAERAKAVRGLLQSPATGFVVVTAPDDEALAQAVALGRRLGDDGYPVAGVVLNRVHPLPPGGLVRPEALARALADAGAPDAESLAARAAATLEEEQVLGLRDLDAREALSGALNGAPVTHVPALEREPVELEGVAEVAAALGGPVELSSASAQRAAGRPS